MRRLSVVNDTGHPRPELQALQQQLQAARSIGELAQRAVNESQSALAAEQAVLWWADVASRRLAMVGSGLAHIHAGSLYEQWLVALLESITPEPFDTPSVFTLADLPERVTRDGVEWFPGYLLHCPVRLADGTVFGGLLFFRAEQFADADRAAGQWIAEATGQSLSASSGQ
jgi:hypothetical protein